MKVLLIGSGGREHALAWKLAQSPLLDTLYAAPGNPGIAECATLVSLNVEDHAAVSAFCKENGVGFVVVGPEAPLVAGLADALRADGIDVFGPSAAAAQLEERVAGVLNFHVTYREAGGGEFLFDVQAKDEAALVQAVPREYRRQKDFARQAKLAYGVKIIPNGVDESLVDQIIEVLREQLGDHPEIQKMLRERRTVLVIVPRGAPTDSVFQLQNIKGGRSAWDGLENTASPDGTTVIGVLEETISTRTWLRHLVGGHKGAGVPCHEIGHVTYDAHPEIHARVVALFEARQRSGQEFVTDYAANKHEPKEKGNEEPSAEYFAESVSAYFDRNEDRERSRAWLARHDPEMFAIIDGLQRSKQ